METKIIVVTGNTGKTVLSYYLAENLSRRYKTILISSDDTKPVYRCLFPSKKKEEPRSLGRLFSLPVVHDEDVFSCGTVVNKNLLMLSYDIGETRENYPMIFTINLKTVFPLLQEMAEFIVIDAAAELNAIDSFALKLENSREICITSADVRGLYYRINRPENSIHVVWQSNPYNSLQDTLNSFNDGRLIVLPYCKCFEGIYNGVSIRDIQPKKEYLRAVCRIVEAIK